jgi:hypothetical protein
MSTTASRAHREAKQRIAQQTVLIEELEEAGHKTLAGVARNMLTAMRKSEELRQPYLYRQMKNRRGKAHIRTPHMLMG